jgi:hypothetical protein
MSRPTRHDREAALTRTTPEERAVRWTAHTTSLKIHLAQRVGDTASLDRPAWTARRGVLESRPRQKPAQG